MTIVKPGLWRRFVLALRAFFSVARFGVVSEECLWGAPPALPLLKEPPEPMVRTVMTREQARRTKLQETEPELPKPARRTRRGPKVG